MTMVRSRELGCSPSVAYRRVGAERRPDEPIRVLVIELVDRRDRDGRSAQGKAAHDARDEEALRDRARSG